jgi:uncharacterized protein (DUF1800 family)
MKTSDSIAEVAAAPRAKRVTRRELFSAAGLAAAAFWTARPAKAAPPDTPADTDPSSLLSRLVHRATMGFSEQEYALARQLGYEGYLEYQLAHEFIDDSAMDTILGNQARFSSLTMTYTQLLALPGGQVANECVDAAIMRCVFSKRQLFERTVEFWTDHFNIDITGERNAVFKAIDDREVVRPHALGNFWTLLDASAHSPAMLYYLNNDISVAGNPNENYARELMELHTMGATGGYTQQDVIEVARCFTGWTIWRDAAATPGLFRYNSAVHDTGQKVVLGNVIPARSAAAGVQDGLDVLAILRTHPSTASYVSGKLCHWLLGDAVPQGVIDSVAAVYLASQGDIKAMVRQALRPNHLAAAGLKYKRPWHHFISAMRALPTTITNSASIRSRLLSAGQPRFAWPTPDGYPDKIDYWVGNIMPRWNFGADMMNNALAGVSVNTTGLFTGLTTADQVMARINSLLMGGEMPRSETDPIGVYMQPTPTGATQQREALGLAIGAPSFQWY